MAKKVWNLAKELSIDPREILAKCRAEGIPETVIRTNSSPISAGLEATIREWFSPHAGAFAEAARRIEEARRGRHTHISLSGLSLTRIPETLWKLTELQKLSLNGNRLTSLPAQIGQLTLLRSLGLDHNELTSLPSTIGNLTNLRYLDIGHNRLTTLPEAIGKLTALDKLSLSHNQLTSLPDTVGNLTGLTRLYVGSNRLVALPDSIGQLVSLKALFLFDNKLKSIPEAIGKLTALQTLALNANHLTSLPEEIGNLTALQTLHLDNNHLMSIANAVGQLERLQTLDLSHNRLSAVPETIGTLASLTHINLSHNRLTSVPRSFRSLSNLMAIFLHDNPGLQLPPEVLGPAFHEVGVQNRPAKPSEILAYYFSLRNPFDDLQVTTTPRINECKLLIVGQGDVGKSSLVERLVHGTFTPNKPRTEGIARERWSVPSRHEGERVTLNIWDFGGQEIMHATHRFFLTKRSLYLIVIDARKGENESNLHYWLSMVRTFGEDSPVIVVTNQCEPPNDLNLNEHGLKRDHPNIRGFVKTSCLTGRGIDELTQLVKREIEQSEHVYNRLPPGWAEVKAELAEAAARRKYVDEKVYCGIAEKHGVTDAGFRRQLLGLLHDLGTVLNYGDEEDRYGLKETHILDPEWVTGGVYRLLNKNELFQAQGVLPLRDLPSHLREQDGYDEAGRRFIVGMMKKFQLCFDQEWDGKPGVLIPELLTKNEPVLPWGAEGTLAFEYHYDVLPEGLIPRFIVLSHSKHARGASRWRTGVVLEDEGCRMLVRGDANKVGTGGRVVIHVQPINKTVPSSPRLALKTARNYFGEIHRNVPARAMVPLTDDPKADPIRYEYLCELERDEGSGYTWKPDGASRKYSVGELLNGIESAEERAARIKEKSVFGYRHIIDRPIPFVSEPQTREEQPPFLTGAGAPVTWWKPLIAPSVVGLAAVILALLLRSDATGWVTMVYAVFVVVFGAVWALQARHQHRTIHWAKVVMYTFATIFGGGVLASGFSVEGEWTIAPGLKIGIGPGTGPLMIIAGLIGTIAFGIIQYWLDRAERPNLTKQD